MLTRLPTLARSMFFFPLVWCHGLCGGFPFGSFFFFFLFFPLFYDTRPDFRRLPNRCFAPLVWSFGVVSWTVWWSFCVAPLVWSFPLVLFFFSFCFFPLRHSSTFFDGALLRCPTRLTTFTGSILCSCLWCHGRVVGLPFLGFFFFFFPLTLLTVLFLRCSSPTPDVLVRHPTDRTLFSRSSLLTCRCFSFPDGHWFGWYFSQQHIVFQLWYGIS